MEITSIRDYNFDSQDKKEVNLFFELQSLQKSEMPTRNGLNPEIIGKVGLGLKNASPHILDNIKPMQKSPTGDKLPFVEFAPVTENHLVKDNIIFNTYSKSGFSQTKDLLYRVIKTDARLVRSVLEQSGFSYTDSHD